MNANEVMKARENWEKARTGYSPLMGNICMRARAERGIIIREIIATRDNGLKVVGYRDKQNRYVAILTEV